MTPTANKSAPADAATSSEGQTTYTPTDQQEKTIMTQPTASQAPRLDVRRVLSAAAGALGAARRRPHSETQKACAPAADEAGLTPAHLDAASELVRCALLVENAALTVLGIEPERLTAPAERIVYERLAGALQGVDIVLSDRGEHAAPVPWRQDPEVEVEVETDRREDGRPSHRLFIDQWGKEQPDYMDPDQCEVILCDDHDPHTAHDAEIEVAAGSGWFLLTERDARRMAAALVKAADRLAAK